MPSLAGRGRQETGGPKVPGSSPGSRPREVQVRVPNLVGCADLKASGRSRWCRNAAERGDQVQPEPSYETLLHCGPPWLDSSQRSDSSGGGTVGLQAVRAPDGGDEFDRIWLVGLREDLMEFESVPMTGPGSAP